MKSYTLEMVQEWNGQTTIRLKINAIPVFSFGLSQETFDRKFIATKELIGKLASEWCHANGTEVEAQRLTYCKDCVNEHLDR